MTQLPEEDPDTRDAREWMRLARAGDFEGAWQVSDRILARSGVSNGPEVPRHYQRIWNGTPLAGRRVLIHCYHGLGDTIQFARYVPLVQEIAREVTVRAQPALLPLLRTLPGCGRLVPLDEEPASGARDVDIEIMELPRAFRTTTATIPRRVPYLSAEPIELHDPRPRIGLAWRGGEWETRRSIPFRELAPLLDLDRPSFYALQLDVRPDERHDQLKVLDTGTISRLARSIGALDLVITLDSMPAHLAGALGVPVWTLLCHEADWRWMERRGDSPWYPTMRLFRQPAAGDWRTPIATVRAALSQLTSARAGFAVVHREPAPSIARGRR
jgi:hypothetical protein